MLKLEIILESNDCIEEVIDRRHGVRKWSGWRKAKEMGLEDARSGKIKTSCRDLLRLRRLLLDIYFRNNTLDMMSLSALLRSIAYNLGAYEYLCHKN